MALDIPLPRQVLTHAHWTLGRAKMSKSRGNVVNPFFALERFGVDTMRYYLAHDGGLRDDASYDNSYIIERYKKGLQGGLGNLVSRVVRGRKGWSVRRAVERGMIKEDDPSPVERRKRFEELPEKVARSMEELDPGAALHLIMNGVYSVRSIDPKAPEI
jgi:methionyl-tRNA synthetase